MEHRYQGKIYELKQTSSFGESCRKCAFNPHGCAENSNLCGDLGYFVEMAPPTEQTTKIKSDGGSSDYYKLKIKRASDGQEFECEMGDVIYSVFGGDFDLGNIVKACRRMYLDTQGAGKDGIDAEYDGKKIEWFTKDFLQRVNSKGE